MSFLNDFESKQDGVNDTVEFVIRVAIVTLSAVILVVVLALVVGMFVPNDVVDSTAVLEMINPAFQTIIGALVGLLGGLSLNANARDTDPEPAPAPAPEPEAPLELTPAMRREAVRLPDLPHRRSREPDGLPHRPERPVRRLVRRRRMGQADDLGSLLVRCARNARRPRLLPKQAIDALDHEPLLPAPDAGLGLARRRHDRRCSEAVSAEKDDPTAPHMLLR